MELDPISPDFWVPFPRTRFSIGLPPLWLHLIEAWCGVEERKGERTGATPPFWGCLRVRTHFSFPMCGCGHGDTPVGVAPLSFIPAGRLGLGPDNRKRSQAKLLSFPVWPGRRKPVDRAGDFGRIGFSFTVRTGEIGADRRKTHQCSRTQAQDAAAHFDGILNGTHHR